MLKGKDNAVYFKWWNYWISKVPQSRGEIAVATGWPSGKTKSHVGRDRVKDATLAACGMEVAHRADESNPTDGTPRYSAIRVGDWED